MSKQANKQTRTLEFEFTLAPRNNRQQGDGGGGGGGGNGGGGSSSRYRQRQNEREANYDHFVEEPFLPPQPAYDARNEHDFPSLMGAGAAATMFSLQPTVNQAKSFGRSGLARTKENFPALGKDVVGQQDSSSASSVYNKASASALLKGANGAANSKSSSSRGVVIHVSNRPKKHQASTSGKDFPSLPGANLAKSNLETDFIPPPSLSMSAAVSSKHRNLVESYESVGGRDPETKLSLVQRSANGGAIKKTVEKVPKMDSVNMFPALGGGGGGNTSVSMTPSTWVTKKPPVESKKAKVAPPPLSISTAGNTTLTTKSATSAKSGDTKTKFTNAQSAANKSTVVASKKENKSTKIVGDSKPSTTKSKKPTSNPTNIQNDSETDSIVPSAAVLSAVSAKHRSLVVDYESVASDSSKFHVIKNKDTIASPRKVAANVVDDSPALNSKALFPSLKSNSGGGAGATTKHREKNNNTTASRFAEIIKLAPPPEPEEEQSTADEEPDKENDNNNDASTLTGDDFPSLGLSITGPPPGFAGKGAGKTQPPPGFNKVTVNSVAKPINNLTFTNSLGESFSIMPGHRYVPPPNASRRNQDLVTQFYGVLQRPDIVDEFKMISQLFITGSYLAQPYYEHCVAALADKFDAVFPELLALLPDISKQQVSGYWKFYFINLGLEYRLILLRIVWIEEFKKMGKQFSSYFYKNLLAINYTHKINKKQKKNI